MLPAELGAAQSTASQHLPEFGLCVPLLFSEAAREFEQFPRQHGRAVMTLTLPSSRGRGKRTQRSLAVGLLAQPKRAHQGNLRPAAGRLAAHPPRPQVGDRRGPVRVLRVEVGQLLFGLPLDLGADVSRPMLRVQKSPI